MSTESAKSTTNSTKPGTNYDLQFTTKINPNFDVASRMRWKHSVTVRPRNVKSHSISWTVDIDGHQIHPSWLESFWRERPWQASGHSSKVQVLLSVQDLHDMNGHESFSNSGYSVIGVRPLDTKATCGEPDLNWLHCHSVRQTRFVHFCPLLIHSS